MTSSLYLVGNREIRLLLGNISRQRVYQLTTRSDFPEPVATLSQGKVWLGADVESWMDRKRRPRPAMPANPPDPDTDPDRPEPQPEQRAASDWPAALPEIPAARQEPVTWVRAAPRPRTEPSRTVGLNAGRAYETPTVIPCCLHALEGN